MACKKFFLTNEQTTQHQRAWASLLANQKTKPSLVRRVPTSFCGPHAAAPSSLPANHSPSDKVQPSLCSPRFVVVVAEMALMIQTAGTPSARRKRVRGADAPPNSVRIDTRVLPNPYNQLPEHHDMNDVMEFLMDASPTMVKRFVATGCAAIRNQQPVVVVCTYGRHRSRAIAQMIADNFGADEVFLHHREKDA